MQPEIGSKERAVSVSSAYILLLDATFLTTLGPQNTIVMSGLIGEDPGDPYEVPGGLPPPYDPDNVPAEVEDAPEEDDPRAAVGGQSFEYPPEPLGLPEDFEGREMVLNALAFEFFGSAIFATLGACANANIITKQRQDSRLDLLLPHFAWGMALTCAYLVAGPVSGR